MHNNKIIHTFLLVSFLFTLFSCAQKPGNEKRQTAIDKKNIVPEEVWVLYKKQDTIFHVKKLLISDTGFVLLSYDINTSQPEAAVQTLVSTKKVLTENECNKIKMDNSGFNWLPYKKSTTLFVQIQPSAFKVETEALNRLWDIEQKIETALKSQHMGERSGSDLGPGGINILFDVSDINNTVPLVLDVLSKERLDTKALIGRRLNTKAEDWFYEVIYPCNYNGSFITM